MLLERSFEGDFKEMVSCQVCREKEMAFQIFWREAVVGGGEGRGRFESINEKAMKVNFFH